MALFTDGPPSGVQDLTALDSQLMEVASVEGIDVTAKLALAHEHAGIAMDGMLRQYLTSPRMEQVVVTPVLRVWHTYLTLELIYADAFHNQRNDRYAAKRDEFGQRARWASEKLMEIGVGMTAEPMPRAATPEISEVPGLLADGLYFVSMSWVNGAGEEGTAAIPATIVTNQSSFLVQPGSAPALACGWNVYAGTQPDALIRQNAFLVGTGDTWRQPGALMASGPKPGNGQSPAYLYPIQRILMRG
jgi:hypothetical protein